VALLPTGSNETQLAPPLPIEAPAIIAFYSFKGGVGRTTPSLECASMEKAHPLTAMHQMKSMPKHDPR
jgi:hypothetical protein